MDIVHETDTYQQKSSLLVIIMNSNSLNDPNLIVDVEEKDANQKNDTVYNVQGDFQTVRREVFMPCG